jgi:hypothetical protein
LLWHGTVPHAEWPVYVETSQAEWLLTLSRCGVAARNSRVPAIRERYCRARHDRKSTRVSFSLSRPTRPGDEIGGEVSASRTWWSTATRRWRGVDCQDAPAIRECLERRWLHELMRPSGRLGTLHARCHALARRRACIAFDLMEPERPKVDRAVLDFVKAHVFDPADFVIRIDGVCQLNPEMVRTVVTRLWTQKA